MKRISIFILITIVFLASCKKTPEVNLKYVDVERDLVTVGTTTANIQCDYDYIATLKKAYLYYGEGEDEANMTSAEMQVVQKTLYVELAGLKENTTYHYYYEFVNGFNSMRSVLKTFKTEKSPDTPPAITLPTVITAEVTEITTNSAKSGGEVTNDGGSEVTERGICWSTNANPTLTDNHVSAGTGTGAFTAVMSGLEMNTTYHVRAYAINEKGAAYGLDKEFVTDEEGCDCGYVDLGLPSGTLWATCNVGASTPEEYGDYFAWGEIATKTTFNWSTYKHCNGDIYQLTKYTTPAFPGNNGIADNLTTLLPEDDAAKVNWGIGWRMPTEAEWEELCSNTTHTWTTQNGVNGRRFTASNGNSLFLPAAGYYDIDELYHAGYFGRYWSSSLYTDYAIDSWNFYFNSMVNYGMNGSYRYAGFSVRPVRSGITPPPGNTPEGAVKGLFTVNANGDQVYFSKGNLQYQASTNTWRFAESQFSFVGGVDCQTGIEWGNLCENGIKCDNSLLSSTYNGWIDLFGWGTSGYHDDNDPYNIHYQPWEAENYLVNSQYNWCGFGPSTNMPSPNLTGSSANYDWGVYNAIINGGNVANQWRTLSKEEWEYIINYRNTISGVRYAKCMVDGYESLILLPDNWNSSLYDLHDVNSSTASFNSNIITLAAWEGVFANEGTVLLLATGVRGYDDISFSDVVYCRNGIQNGGDLLSYWTATFSDGEPSEAFCFYFTDYWGGPNCRCFRATGRSVRLVHDAH